MEPDTVPLTDFHTRYGHFELVFLPTKLINAPAILRDLIHNVFENELDKFFIVYLDNILSYNKTLPDHLNYIKIILKEHRKKNCLENFPSLILR